ncbi:MAG TPA: endo-1,4-beta-xylanase [Candidatus Limnocylindrales bacterium]
MGLAAVIVGALGAVMIAAPAQAALRDAAGTANRFIGYAANASLLCNNTATCTSGSNATYRNLAATEFNQVTAENVMKWESVEPNDDQYNFAPGDGIVAFAQANGQQVHGHTLVWHSQTPGYVQGLSATAMRAEMQEHITALVGRYASNPAVVSWDVVNEAISDNNGAMRTSFWFNTLGVSYIADAFRFARAADANADLCINDYSIDGINAKSTALFNLVQSLLSQGVPITCVGFQAHLVINQIPGDFVQNMQRFANLGLNVRITELDIRIPLPADAQELQTQAQNYTTVVNACRAVAACDGITTWGIDDGNSWLPNSCCGGGNEAAALLWNASFQQKPAYAAVNTALGGSPNPQVPGAPGTPVASNVTASSLTLSWPAASGTVTNYQIERATGATSTAFTQVGTSTTTTFNDSGLAANTTYRYRVRATNSAGPGPYSPITNVTTGGGTGQVPGAPGTPTTSNVTASSLTLSWPAASGTVTNYQIERATGATSTTFTQVGTSTTTTFNDSGLAANTTYRYRVRATNSAGPGPYSPITNVTTSGGGTGGTCTYRFDSWQVGYVAYVTVNGPRSGWSIPFTMNAADTIVGSWNATITPASGANRTATNVSYNGNLAAGQSTQWGFQANRPAGGALPTFTGCTAE